MRDNEDGNPTHSGAFGWQRQAEEGQNPTQGSLHGWDRCAEESMTYGRQEWYAIGPRMGNRCWDSSTGIKYKIFNVQPGNTYRMRVHNVRNQDYNFSET